MIKDANIVIRLAGFSCTHFAFYSPARKFANSGKSCVTETLVLSKMQNFELMNVFSSMVLYIKNLKAK